MWKYEVLLLTNLITHSHYGLAQLKHMDSYCLFKLKRGRECAGERERKSLTRKDGMVVNSDSRSVHSLVECTNSTDLRGYGHRELKSVRLLT